MRISEPEWIRAACQALALALLLAGAVQFLRLLGRWLRGVTRIDAPLAVARLRARPWRPLDAVLLLLALLLPSVSSLRDMLQPPASGNAAAPAGALSFVPLLLYYAMILAAVLLAARHTGIGAGAALGIARNTLWPSARAGVTLGLAALPPLALTSWTADVALRWLHVPVVRQPVFDVLADPGLGAAARTFLLFAALLAAPLAEETVFRGVLLPSVLRGRPLLHTLLLVNALFALLHLNAAAFLPLLAIGFCFSAGMLATGSLVTPIVMHAIFNGEMLLLFFAWPRLAA